MISPFMLPQKCRIHRIVSDETQSFVTTENRLVGEYPCYVSQKQTASQSQDGVRTLVTSNLEVLMNLPADIQQGDKLECEGTTYSVGLVYKPANRHIQADIHAEDET